MKNKGQKIGWNLLAKAQDNELAESPVMSINEMSTEDKMKLLNSNRKEEQSPIYKKKRVLFVDKPKRYTDMKSLFSKITDKKSEI